MDVIWVASRLEYFRDFTPDTYGERHKDVRSMQQHKGYWGRVERGPYLSPRDLRTHIFINFRREILNNMYILQIIWSEEFYIYEGLSKSS